MKLRYATLVILVLILMALMASCAEQKPSKAKQIAQEILKQAEEKAQKSIDKAISEDEANAGQQEQKSEREGKDKEKNEKTQITGEESLIQSEEAGEVADDANKTLTEVSGDTGERDNQSQTVQTIIEEENQQDNGEKTIPASAMNELLTVFERKVSSYSFTHNSNKYSVKGERYRIILEAPNQKHRITINGTEYDTFIYDTIYVDRTAKTALAYCEGWSSEVNTQCAKYEIYDLPFRLNFEDNDIKLPEDWLFDYLDLPPRSVSKDKYYVNGRQTWKIDFEGAVIFFDPKTGLAIKSEQIKNSKLETNTYDKLSSNTVRDIDVIHRSKSEILSQETFYK
ncbi:hypothetical protein D6825_03285 [Candidatus Woesearchaeota archaeon]|nr:MAG: hypothetical protein D6825_03285 [Candidatus Woesearchaeota archaeon]